MAAKDASGDEKLIDEKMKEAVELIANGGTIGDLAGLTANDYEAIYGLAFNFAGANKYDKAADLLRFLVVNDPVEARWCYALGVVEQARSNYAAAVDAYAVAAILDADDPLPSLQGGYCLMSMGEYERAAEAFECVQLIAEDKPAQVGVLAQAKTMLETVRKNQGRKEEKA